ncbi:MAG: hypothetical protein DMF53_22725 [Acidobacteria bacterium]|nr:MAG: hypothetical protein DMF53_22725 [Acidobacteriota bacterium]
MGSSVRRPFSILNVQVSLNPLLRSTRRLGTLRVSLWIRPRTVSLSPSRWIARSVSKLSCRPPPTSSQAPTREAGIATLGWTLAARLPALQTSSSMKRPR